MAIKLPQYEKTIETKHFTTKSEIIRLPYVFHALGITNKGNVPVKVYLSESNPNSYVVVDANSYKEVSVSSNYIKFVYDATGLYDITFEIFSLFSEGFLAPRFPNLYVQDINGNRVLYNPLTTEGFFTETYSYGDSLAVNRPYNSETMLEVDYWFNGQKLSSTDGTFSGDFFTTLIQNFITSVFPYSNVNDVLRPLPGGQTADIINKIKDYWQQIDRPINDEYVGGWAKLESFDRKLSLLNFVLSAGDKIEFPFTVLGFNIENLDSASSATVRIYNDSSYTDQTISPSSNYVGNLEPATKFEVLSGLVKISFSGYAVKMLTFAPIINIYYPIGFDETSGLPNDAYTLFQNQLTEFENWLANAKFSGRVFKYKWVQHVPETRNVWDADYYQITFADSKIPLPFDELRLYLRDWYAYSQLEKQIISRVWDENYSVLGQYGKPKDMNEIINNDNIVYVLGQDFSGYAAGTARRNAKKEFLRRVLLEGYLGNYAGTLTYSIN